MTTPTIPLDTSKVYDVSPEEMDRIKRRAEIRARLKAEFNRQYYNPYRQVYQAELVCSTYERMTIFLTLFLSYLTA